MSTRILRKSVLPWDYKIHTSRVVIYVKTYIHNSRLDLHKYSHPCQFRKVSPGYTLYVIFRSSNATQMSDLSVSWVESISLVKTSVITSCCTYELLRIASNAVCQLNILIGFLTIDWMSVLEQSGV